MSDEIERLRAFLAQPQPGWSAAETRAAEVRESLMPELLAVAEAASGAGTRLVSLRELGHATAALNAAIRRELGES